MALRAVHRASNALAFLQGLEPQSSCMILEILLHQDKGLLSHC